MNALQKTLAILALLVLVPQTVRHAYHLWLEPRGSVLDKYDRPLRGEIGNATSLEELLARYDKVRKEFDQKRQERLASGVKDNSYSYDLQSEPYKSEHELREAILDWEKKSSEIREMRFYWAVGLVLLVLGSVIFKKLNRWLGLTLVITAFSEFIYWTSPTFFGADTHEYDRLLVNKLALSAVSLILLLSIIWANRVFGTKTHLPEA